MMGWYDGHGWMGFGWIFMLLVWGLALFVLIRVLRRRNPDTDAGAALPRTPLNILKERYARGEIGREEYQQIRRDLED